jgi:hypothetical protein
LLTFLICLRLSDIVYFERRKDGCSICRRRRRRRRHQVPAECDGPSRGWTRYRTLLLLFVLLLLPILFLLLLLLLLNWMGARTVAPKKPVIMSWCIIPCACITMLRRSTNYSIANIKMVSAKLVFPVLYSLSTLCSIFCGMNAMTLFSFPCCIHRLSSQYIHYCQDKIFYDLLLFTYESQQCCLLITDVC